MRKRTAKPAGGGRRRSPGSEAIGDRLRTIFDDVVNEPVPDEFMRLLEQADKNRRGGGDVA
jgi:hypothetical protein